MNEKPTCTFSYGGLRPSYNVHVGFFHSYLKETKKINNQFLNEISKRKLENALLTEQIERQVLFCTVTLRLLHHDAKIHATLARLYNVLENWRG